MLLLFYTYNFEKHYLIIYQKIEIPLARLGLLLEVAAYPM